MEEKKLFQEKTSRRTFLKQSAFAIAAASFLPSLQSCSNMGSKSASGINSKFSGVQIGAITYSWRSMTPRTVEDLIGYCKEANLSSLELMSGELENFLGVPKNPTNKLLGEMRAKAAKEQAEKKLKKGEQPKPFELSEEQKAELKAAGDKFKEELKTWRTTLDMSKVEAIRKQLNDAGINVHIVKYSPAGWSDEEIDYAFRATKAMGAMCITQEIDVNSAKRLAPFAEKHGMYVGMHNHAQYGKEGFSCDPVLAVSPSIMLNFDCGHYYGSTGKHPVDFIKKYKDRIYSIHLKDKTGPTTKPADTNQVWGQGETPLKDVLTLLKTEKWPIYCDIELEYEIKPWSNAVKELGVCVRHAREILL